MYYLVFNDTFIYILISFAQLLYINVIQQVFILEHLDGTECSLVLWDSSDEIIGHLSLSMECIIGNLLLYLINTQFLVIAKLNVVFTSRDFAPAKIAEWCEKPILMKATIGKSS